MNYSYNLTRWPFKGYLGLWKPTAKTADIAHHHLGVSIIDQLDCIGWTFTGAGSTTLALRRVNESGSAKASDPTPSFLLDNLGNGEGAGAGTGETADAFIGVYNGNNTTQVEGTLG